MVSFSMSKVVTWDYVRFPLRFKKEACLDTMRLIQDMESPHCVVIRGLGDVGRGVIWRTTCSWGHNIGMWVKDCLMFIYSYFFVHPTY